MNNVSNKQVKYCLNALKNGSLKVTIIFTFVLFSFISNAQSGALWNFGSARSQQATGAQVCNPSCAGCNGAGVSNVIWTVASTVVTPTCGANTCTATMTSYNQGQTELLTDENYFTAGNIPAGATITGIEVCVNASSASATDITINNVQLLVGGVTVGAVRGPSANLTVALAQHTFGGYADMWGLTSATLTPAAVNAANFGIAFTCNSSCCSTCGASATGLVHINCVQIAVFYGGFTGAPTHATGIASAFNCAVVLPIELTSFNAVPAGDQVDLSWTTASETNNALFRVERSEDAQNWQTVTTHPGAGNSTYPISYTAVDKAPFLGQSYYRLKQTDYDGNFTYSGVMPVTVTEPVGQMLIYPNPATNSLHCNLPTGNPGLQTVRIIDVTGRVVMNSQVMVPDNGQIEFSIANLQSGMYITEVTNGGQVMRKTFIKQ